MARYTVTAKRFSHMSFHFDELENAKQTFDHCVNLSNGLITITLTDRHENRDILVYYGEEN